MSNIDKHPVNTEPQEIACEAWAQIRPCPGCGSRAVDETKNGGYECGACIDHPLRRDQIEACPGRVYEGDECETCGTVADEPDLSNPFDEDNYPED